MCICMYIYVCMYVCMHICIYVCIYACIYARTHIQMHTYRMYIHKLGTCRYIHTYMHMHTYAIYTHKLCIRTDTHMHMNFVWLNSCKKMYIRQNTHTNMYAHMRMHAYRSIYWHSQICACTYLCCVCLHRWKKCVFEGYYGPHYGSLLQHVCMYICTLACIYMYICVWEYWIFLNNCMHVDLMRERVFMHA
jgi:hypothetical protein